MKEGFFKFVSALEPSELLTPGPLKSLTLDLTDLRSTKLSEHVLFQKAAQERVANAVRVFCDEVSEKLGHGQFFVYVRELTWSTAYNKMLVDLVFETRLVTLKKDRSPIVLYNNVPAEFSVTLDFP